MRQALWVDYGGEIAFRVDKRGVTLLRVDERQDPAIGAFIDFRADDLQKRPDAVKALRPGLAARIASLTSEIKVETDTEIEGDQAL